MHQKVVTLTRKHADADLWTSSTHEIFEPGHSISYKLVQAPSNDSDHPDQSLNMALCG